MSKRWTIRLCALCDQQGCDGHCVPDDYADPYGIEVMPVAETERLRDALRYCVLDCCALPLDETDGELVLSPNPCESCARAVTAVTR